MGQLGVNDYNNRGDEPGEMGDALPVVSLISKSPTTEPTTEPTNEPTIPTINPTFDPTTEPTVEPTTDPTTEPTLVPTMDPTQEPTTICDPYESCTECLHVNSMVPDCFWHVTYQRCYYYNELDGDEAVISDEEDCTDSTETTQPTTDPIHVEPTIEPTKDPTSLPTLVPTEDPTTDPTNGPTTDPTEDPTIEPTAPTMNPTEQPSSAPTASPLALKMLLKLRVDDKWKFDEFSEYVCFFIIGGGVIAVSIAFLIGHRRNKNGYRYHVERQQYLSVILYVLQIIDVVSDICFSFQMNKYKVHGQIDHDVDHRVFRLLYTFSFIFVVVPYFLNIVSSVRVVQRITAGDSISEYTKKYFQQNAKLYSVLTIMSGGAFPALKLMNSNFLSLPMFNAGLSELQLERFRVHHVVSSLIMENLPQLALQAFVMFHLKISSTIVLISFGSSVFNVTMNILTAAVHIILHRSINESKFTILVSWSPQQRVSLSLALSKSAVRILDPFSRTGRRRTLAKQLGLIQFGGSKSVHFDIMASEKKKDCYALYGVMHFDEQNESAAELLAKFMEKEQEILDAIISAFGYYPRFTDQFQFDLEVSRSQISPRADKAKVISDLMLELGVEPQRIKQSLQWITVQFLYYLLLSPCTD